MRIIVMGTVEFSSKCLTTLLESPYRSQIVGIISMSKNSFNSDFASLIPIAKENEIPVYMGDLNDPTEMSQWCQSHKVDIVYCLGWSKLIPKEFIDAIPRGVIGFHPSKLPLNRGRHPLIWAIVLGLKETATTYFQMDPTADTGDILSQVDLEISESENATSLYQKMLTQGSLQLLELTKNLDADLIIPIKQNPALGNTWRKRARSDGIIDWRMSAQSIHRLIKSLTPPYPGAEMVYQGNFFKIFASSIIDEIRCDNIEPGLVTSKTNLAITIKCGEGQIEIPLAQNLELNSIEIGEYL